MKVLIVDDNKNNRMILQLLLEDYMDDNEGVKLCIDEAEDGQIAVDKCREENYDIVFMDIMMPNMDGIEATKIIRSEYPKILIVAVSAVDDSERKKLILSSGAEDYISKPVNADIFINRISNYLALCESRKHTQRHSNHVWNLYTEDIYNRHTAFMLDSEDSLAEFWEFFLLNARRKSDFLSDVVRAIISIAEKQLSLQKEHVLYIEESEEKQYFTLSNIDTLPRKVIDLLLIKNGIKDSFVIKDDKLSFELLKLNQEEVIEDGIEPVVAFQEEVVQEKAEDIASPLEIKSSLHLQVFDYIDSDDLYDLEEYAGKLNSIMLIVGGGDVTEEEVMDIYTYLEKLGSVLATYTEVYPIAKALSELSVTMSSHVQDFMDNSEALGPMCKAFSNDMSKWIEQSFHTGAPSADFMNDTIVVNCQTIGGMLTMNEATADGGEDFDDIFDF